jgi:stage II sporulation protein D
MTTGQTPNLTNEGEVAAFLKRNTDASFDAKAPFYRWTVTLTRNELEKTLTKGLIEREKADRALGTDFVQTLQGTPVDPANAKFSIGTLKDLKVIERGEGGNIMTLEIVTSNGTYRVKKEYNLRLVIRPRKDYTGSAADLPLVLHDGTVLQNYSLLPSAFATFEMHRTADGALESVTIYGGGNGHGVGMSQWAMRGMVEAGYSIEDIIQHFYRGAKVETVY